MLEGVAKTFRSATYTRSVTDKEILLYRIQNWVKALDVIQLGLDIAGLIPGFGEAFDGINAVIYLARGDKANAALSAAAMIPVIGMAATGGKILGKTVKYSDEVIDAGKSIKVKKGGQGINQPIDEFDDSQIYFDAAKSRSAGGTGQPLLLEAPKGANPWLDGSEMVSMTAPKDFKINMAMAENQTKPGGWGTLDNINDVDYVRNQLAVTPEFKPEVSKVQQFLVPEGTRIQVGTVGPQMQNGVLYPGGGNQVQILNYSDRDKLIPIGEPYNIK